MGGPSNTSVVQDRNSSGAVAQNSSASTDSVVGVAVPLSSPVAEPPVASSSSSGSVEFREHILNQIAEVHKAMEMELITEKAGQQIISVLTRAPPPTQPAAPIAPTTAAALPAATTASSASSVAAAQVIATPSKIVIDPAAKQDIQKRLHKLLNNISALKNTFSTQVSGTSK